MGGGLPVVLDERAVAGAVEVVGAPIYLPLRGIQQPHQHVTVGLAGPGAGELENSPLSGDLVSYHCEMQRIATELEQVCSLTECHGIRSVKTGAGIGVRPARTSPI